VKLLWIKKRYYTDNDAYNIGIYKKKNWSKNARAKKWGQKVFINLIRGGDIYLRR
jgi:hypothetical protein